MISFAIIIACLFINMLLSGSEMAFVTVNRQHLKQRSAASRSARMLLHLKTNPERTLSVIQIGITLVGAIAAAVGGAGAEQGLSPLLIQKLDISLNTANVLAIIIVVLPISFLNVVIGELVPKSLALRHPLLISLGVAPMLYWAERLLSPAVSVLEYSTNIVLKILNFGRSANPQPEPAFEIEDLNQQTKEYVTNLVSADKKIARDIMVPWSEVIYINRSSPLAEIEQIIRNSRHTRIPVISEDSLFGFINTKDYFAWTPQGESDWQTLVRPILKFKSFEPLFRILLKMQQSKTRIGIIYDSTKHVGMVTMENIFEEIIGDLFDEDDDDLLKKILSQKAHRLLR